MVAQQRAAAAGQHGRQALSLQGEVRMADGVDAAIEAVQAPGRDCAVDRAPGVTERAGQLTDRDDAVLAFREVGKRLVGVRSRFVPHGGSSTAPGFSPRDAERGRRGSNILRGRDLHQPIQERLPHRDRRQDLQDRRVPARQARQGRRLRADQAAQDRGRLGASTRPSAPARSSARCAPSRARCSTSTTPATRRSSWTAATTSRSRSPRDVARRRDAVGAAQRRGRRALRRRAAQRRAGRRARSR